MTTPPTPKTLPDSREAFEAWIRKEFASVRPNLDVFSHFAPQWEIWQAALAAQPPAVAAIPEGWKLVPIEPTDEMCNAEALDVGKKTARSTWAAMLAAAPQPPAHSGEAAGQGAGWLPIETAPTSRPIILLWRTAPWPLRGEWSIDEEFDTRPKGWVSPESGWRNDGDQCIPRNQEDCIGWQKLPPVPSGNGGVE